MPGWGSVSCAGTVMQNVGRSRHGAPEAAELRALDIRRAVHGRSFSLPRPATRWLAEPSPTRCRSARTGASRRAGVSSAAPAVSATCAGSRVLSLRLPGQGVRPPPGRASAARRLAALAGRAGSPKLPSLRRTGRCHRGRPAPGGQGRGNWPLSGPNSLPRSGTPGGSIGAAWDRRVPADSPAPSPGRMTTRAARAESLRGCPRSRQAAAARNQGGQGKPIPEHLWWIPLRQAAPA